jgi:HEAT repeat protein
LGLFDFLGSKEEREHKRVKDLGKKAQEKYGDPLARTKALDALRELGTPEAIATLLARFNAKTEPGITDAEEKEYVFDIVTGFGEKAVPEVKAYVGKSDSVSWGLRCLDALVPADEVIGTLVEVLDRLTREYTRDPEKKLLLVNHLANHADSRIPPIVRPLLDDPSDDVRIAALACLVKQGDAEAREPIIRRFLEDEAPRVRAAAATALADLGVGVQGYRERVEAALPEGWHVDRSGVVKRP